MQAFWSCMVDIAHEERSGPEATNKVKCSILMLIGKKSPTEVKES